MSSNKIIYTKIYPFCVEKLHKKETEKEIKIFFNKFIDTNSYVLLQKSPSEKLYMKHSDRDFFLDMANIPPEQIKSTIKDIKLIGSHWNMLNDPFVYVMTCMIRHYTVEKNEEMAILLTLFFSLHFYALNYLRYFKFVQKDAMDFMINNLSNKHDLKVYQSILGALEKKSEIFYKTYKNKLLKEDDIVFIDYIKNLNTRVNQWIKGLMREYIKVKESGAYFSKDVESFDKDEFKEITNLSLDINRIATNTTRKFFSSSIKMDLIQLASRIADVPTSSLFNTMKDISISNDQKEVYDILNSSLITFLVNNKKEANLIQSSEFINAMLIIYNTSNTTDDQIIKVKSSLDILLTRYNDKYVKTNRVATKINWRKATFLYLIFFLQYSYK
jgi:hypothetical protein